MSLLPEFTAEAEYIIPKPIITTVPDTEILKPIKKLDFDNCWLFLKEKYYGNLPRTADINSNLVDTYSDIAVFYYKKSGLWHYAKTTGQYEDTFTVDEANYKAGERTHRSVKYDDPNLVGFYSM